MELVDVTLRTYPAKAVRVTEENMKEVAEWCGGYIETSALFERSIIPYVTFPVRRGTRETTDYAFVGQWVVHADERFASYKHARFMGKFAMREKDDLIKQRERLRRMVKRSMEMHGAKDRSSDVTVDRTIEDTVDKIMEIFR